MEERPRSPLRLLAPVALLAFGLALFFVLSSSNVPDDSSPTVSRQVQETDLGEATETTETSTTREGEGDGQLPEGCYVVRAGDTLAGIGEKTGVQVDRLQELNPDLDPQALVSGQQINLREAGCD
jgi:LysM repeat protein